MRRLPGFLSADELQRLYRQPNRRYYTGHRNALLLRLMGDAGLRVSEALDLHRRDANLITGRILIREGKGGRDRITYIGEDGLAELRAFVEKYPDRGLLLTTHQGGRVQDRYVRTMVKRYGEKAGIDRDVHPHLLRHTFATHLYQETHNIRLVQKALGHADLSTTMIYTHVLDDELEGAIMGLRKR